jgi:hypothetical protein
MTFGDDLALLFGGQSGIQQLVYQGGIGLTLGLAHHLPHKPAAQLFFTGQVAGKLVRIIVEDLV